MVQKYMRGQLARKGLAGALEEKRLVRLAAQGLKKEQDNQFEQAPGAANAQPLPIHVMVDGATELLDAAETWTESDVKGALAAHMRRPVGDCYFVVGAKILGEGAATTL